MSGVSLRISAEASDNVGVGVRSVSRGRHSLGTDAAAPYSIPWDTTTAIDGFHDLTAIAIDTSNNASKPAFVSVTVLNEAGT